MQKLADAIQPRWTEDRRGWNRTWEKLLDVLYPDNKTFSEALFDTYGKAQWMKGAVHAHIQAAQDQRTQLIDEQHLLREYMLYHSKFPSGWLGLSQEQQEDIILEGLVRTCEAGPDKETRRLFAPESRLAVLTREGGRGLLDLVSQIERAPPREPYLVPHRVYDATIAVDVAGKRSAEEQLVILTRTFARNGFICYLLRQVARAFYGEEQRHRGAVKTDYHKLFARGAKTFFPGRQVDIKWFMKELEWCCGGCGKLESSLPQDRRLQSCAKCKAVGREVKYCGRDCQKRDWRTHKARCGKRDSEITSAEEALRKFTPPASVPGVGIAGDPAGTSPAFPKPLPPLVRSRHLEYQIRLLKDLRKNLPEVDYIYTGSPGGPLIIGPPKSKALFRGLRDQAFQSGDLETVIELYRWLAFSVSRNAEALRELRTQVALEYGVDHEVLARVDLDFSTITNVLDKEMYNNSN